MISTSLGSWITQLGPTALPLIALFLYSLYTHLDQFILWSGSLKKFDDDAVTEAYTLWSQRQYGAAKSIINNSVDPSLRCVRLCLESMGKLNSLTLKSLSQQLLDLHTKKNYLEPLLISLPTSLGLLGTILGLILNLGEGNDQNLGLSQALYSTAAGLILSAMNFCFIQIFKSYLFNLKQKLERELTAFEALSEVQ